MDISCSKPSSMYEWVNRQEFQVGRSTALKNVERGGKKQHENLKEEKVRLNLCQEIKLLLKGNQVIKHLWLFMAYQEAIIKL